MTDSKADPNPCPPGKAPSPAGPAPIARPRTVRGRPAPAAPGGAGSRPRVGLIALLIGLLSAFGAVCIAVATGATGAFDAAILLALREPGDVAQPIGPPWMLETMRDFTALGSTGVLTLLTVGAALYLLVSGRRRTAGLVLVAMVGGLVLNNLLKLGVARPRPDLVPHAVAVFTKSFPSGHAMNSAVVYLTLGTLLARTQRALGPRSLVMTLAVGLPVLIGVSRIYLGVHWPSDVLAGWTLGAGWALAVWLVMSRGQGAQ